MVAPPIARRAALVAPPWGLVYGAFRPAARVGVFYPPLGLCSLAAVLRKAGWAVRVVDAEAESLDLDGVARTLDEFRPTFVGIQVVSPLWEAAVALARIARLQLDVPVLLGGPHVTLLAEEALEQNPWADAAAIGEGEETILEFARAIDEGRDPLATDGLVVRSGDRIVRSGARANPADLDALPDPDRAGLPSHRYLFSVPGQGNRRFTTISSARGCPFECTFCTEPVMHGRRVRYRSPRVVVEEIAAAHTDPGASHFIFVDDTLTLDAGRILEICGRIRSQGLDVTLEGWTHANTVDEKLLVEMRRAGFVRLSFGIESGDAAVLSTLKKGTDLERIRDAIRWAKSAGLETRGSVILGLPGDTRASVERTIDFVTGLRDLDHCYFNIAMPYPGTEMRRRALAGEGGTRLLTKDYSALRRQGQSVVMEVNDLDPSTLLALQRRAYRKFWLHPRRVAYNVRRAGLSAGVGNSWAFLRSFVLPARRKSVAFRSEITAMSEMQTASR